MTIYTGVADENGDFTVPFSSSYTGGQKITVIAEKDSATKTIELHAPSDVSGGGVIQFTGNLTNFPNNIGNMILKEISGSIANSTFEASGGSNIFGKATGLDMSETTIVQVGQVAFQGWVSARFLNLPSTLISIDSYGFQGWTSLQELAIPDSCDSIGASAFNNAAALKKLTIGAAVSSIGDYAFSGTSALDEMIVMRSTPPTIAQYTFRFLKATCVIKVPAASLAAYKAAPRWSEHASKIVGV